MSGERFGSSTLKLELRHLAAIIGTSVIAVKSEQVSEKVTTLENCLNMTPAIPSMKSSGRKTASVVSVLAVIAMATSLAPLIAASSGGMPLSRSRVMFSSTTIELSTSMPTPSASPPSVMMFRL